MIVTFSQDEIAALIGDPAKICEELEAFRETAKFLSSNRPRLIQIYPDQWVALFENEVQAHGDELESVLEELDAKGLPRERALVRYLDTKPRTLVLAAR